MNLLEGAPVLRKTEFEKLWFSPPLKYASKKFRRED
jgi:hypothetical protein